LILNFTFRKKCVMKRLTAVITTCMFLLLVSATPTQAVTRLCFFAHSQVEGSVATLYVGGAAPVQKRVIVNATKFYQEPVSFFQIAIGVLTEFMVLVLILPLFLKQALHSIELVLGFLSFV